MYTRQPYQIQGNIINPQNPDEVVLGYFLVAGVEEQRVFVNRLPETYNYYFDVCTLDEAESEMTKSFWRDLSYGIRWNYDKLFHYNGAIYLVNPPCIDCTMRGGVNVKPDFWIDE